MPIKVWGEITITDFLFCMCSPIYNNENSKMLINIRITD